MKVGSGGRAGRAHLIGVRFDSKVIENDGRRFNLSFNYSVINLAGGDKIEVSLRGKRWRMRRG